MRVALVTLVALAGCGPGEVHVTLAPVPTAGGICGKATGARSFLVSALGDFPTDGRAIDLGGPVDISTFPPETRQLSVEVRGPGGGFETVGVTQPLELGALHDGATIPIFMGPKDGFCAVGPMGDARDRPLVARAGAGALVIGGQAAGAPVRTAEYYDPATGAFTPIALQTTFSAQGFVGAAATTMPAGRVVISGGPSQSYGIYVPATQKFEPPRILGEVRAYHAAIAIDDTHLLIAAGCGFLGATGACQAGGERTTTKIIDLDSGDVADGPMLASVRLGGTAVPGATGADLTGPAGVVLAGGTDLAGNPNTSVERFDPATPAVPATATGGAGGLVAPLPAGGVLVALAAPGAAASGAAAVVAPDQPPHVVGAAPARAGAVLVPLEDGEVAAIGGAAGATVDRYVPALRAWRAFPVGADSVAPAGVSGAAAVRLDDGSVLVVGGHDGTGAAQTGAWIYRPAIGGPFVGSTRATPTVEDPPPALDPLDPSLVDTATGDWQLAARGDPLASWAIIGGPDVQDGTVTATVRPTGGVAILVGFTAPSSFDAVILPAGGTARLERHAPGAVTPLCSGQPVPASVGVGTSVVFAVVREGDRIQASVATGGGGAISILDCAPGIGARGRVGVAPVGQDASVIVDTVEVSR